MTEHTTDGEAGYLDLSGFLDVMAERNSRVAAERAAKRKLHASHFWHDTSAPASHDQVCLGCGVIAYRHDRGPDPKAARQPCPNPGYSPL